MPDQVLSAGFLKGLEFSHYHIIEEIDSGEMSAFFRTHDLQLGRKVAIHVFRPGTGTDEAGRKHFRKKAPALSKLNHHNITTIHDFDARIINFLAMGYIP